MVTAADTITKWLVAAEHAMTGAETSIRAALEHAEAVSNQMLLLGYEGIAHALAPVIETLRTAAANIAAADGQFGAATNALARTGTATNPNQVKEHLNAVTTAIESVRLALATAITHTDTARSQAAVALEGPDPDELIARIGAVTTQLTEAAGNLGNASQAASEELDRIGAAGNR